MTFLGNVNVGLVGEFFGAEARGASIIKIVDEVSQPSLLFKRIQHRVAIMNKLKSEIWGVQFTALRNNNSVQIIIYRNDSV